jgi:tRNA-splicing ligase RtcB
MEVMYGGQMVVFGDHEQKVLDQLGRALDQEENSLGVQCADGHFGYSVPIGGVVAYREHVSPAAVGYDIGCGNLAVETNIVADAEFKKELPAVMDRIFEEVSFGLGGHGYAEGHPVLDQIREAPFEPQRALWSKAATQLGTVGGGNHYVDLFEDTISGSVWIGVHFGSRGFGYNTASGFMALAQGLPFLAEERRAKGLKVKEGEMDAPPDVLSLRADVGQAYIAAMALAGAYAYAGREVVVRQVLDILGAAEVPGSRVHNHHNFAWSEVHNTERLMVTRKGATPAFPGQRGFVGATMDEPAVILEGVQSDASALALYSTVHGAGRAMSRTKAAGKHKKRWSCNNRDCDWHADRGGAAPQECPQCGNKRFSKRMVRVREGEIDWQATLERVKARGVELRGANAEEAPGAYKRLDEVLVAHAGTVRILHELVPLGVAMAPGDIHDPYKE